MDFSPELFVELRKWVTEIGINKSIVVLIVVLTAWRLPVILNILKEVLNFLKEMRVIDLVAKEKRLSLKAKIALERKRRQVSKRKK